MRILLAVLALVAMASIVARIEDWAHREERRESLMRWLENFLLPLGRVFALLLFIVLAYPTLLGLREAPGFGELLDAGHGRFDRLVNVLFFTGLLLPAIPVLRRLPGLLLPMQGMAGVALVAGWVAAAQGHALKVWPSPELWIVIAAAAGLASAVANLLTQAIDDRVLRQDLSDLLILVLQAPLLLIYGHWLGRQLG